MARFRLGVPLCFVHRFLVLTWCNSVVYLALVTGLNTAMVLATLSLRETGLANALGFVAYVLAAASGGRLADRFGPKRVLLVASGVFAVLVPAGLAARSFATLAVAVGVLSGCFGVFYPTVEGLLARGEARLGIDPGQTVSRFCLTWSSANMVGMVLGPFLAAEAPAVLFAGAALVVAAGAVATALSLRAHGEDLPGPAPAVLRQGAAHPRPRPQRRQLLLRGARIGLFCAATALAAVLVMLPQLAAGGRIAAAEAGWVGMGANMAVFVTFVLFASWKPWVDRPWVALAPLLLTFPACVAAFARPVTAGGLWLAMLLAGANYAIPYAYAIHYALDTDRGHGAEGGWHEAVIGSSYIVGPLLAGALMQEYGPQRGLALLLAGLAAVALVAQTALAWRLGRLGSVTGAAAGEPPAAAGH